MGIFTRKCEYGDGREVTNTVSTESVQDAR